MAEAPIELLEPSKLAVKAPLGKGGWGAVYRAIYDGTEVAVKIFCPVESLDRDAAERMQAMFVQEARVGMRIEHRHIVGCKGMLELPGKFPGTGFAQPALAQLQELCTGGSLKAQVIQAMLSSRPTYSYAQALAWLCQVASALDHLHRQSPPVIHRDIKNENILLSRDAGSGELIAKLADLGLHAEVTEERTVLLRRRHPNLADTSMQGPGSGSGACTPTVPVAMPASASASSPPYAAAGDFLTISLRPGMWAGAAQEGARAHVVTNSAGGMKLCAGDSGRRPDVHSRHAAAEGQVQVRAACTAGLSPPGSPESGRGKGTRDARAGLAAVADVDGSLPGLVTHCTSAPELGRPAHRSRSPSPPPDLKASLSCDAKVPGHLSPTGIMLRSEPPSADGGHGPGPHCAAGAACTSGSSGSSGAPPHPHPHPQRASAMHAVELEGAVDRPQTKTPGPRSACVEHAEAQPPCKPASSLSGHHGTCGHTGSISGSSAEPGSSTGMPLPAPTGGSYPGPAGASGRGRRASIMSRLMSGFALAPVASQGSFTRGVHRIKSVLAYMNRPPEGVLPEVGSAEGQQMWVYGLTGEAGSFFSMAPEVYRHQPYNHKADVFSFAVVMYELLAREMLATAYMSTARGMHLGVAEPHHYAERVAEGFRPPQPRTIPDAAWSIISACWAPDPVARPDMPQVLAALEQLREAEARKDAQHEAEHPHCSCVIC